MGTNGISLFFIAALLFAAGCGQNPHVTGSDPASRTSSNQPQEVKPQAPAQAPAPEAVAEQPKTAPAPKEAPPAGPLANEKPAAEKAPGGEKTGPASPGDKASPGEKAPPADLLGEEKEQPEIVAIPGEKGDKGDKGEKGEAGAKGADAPCGPEIRSVPGIVVKALSNSELEMYRQSNGVDLPYLLSNHSLKGYKNTLDLLTINQSNSRVGKMRYVHNAEILFDIDITLPPRNMVMTELPLELVLTLNFFKHPVDHTPDTEIICLLHEQMCSGKEFHTRDYTPLVNAGFGKGAAVVNDFFSKELVIEIKRKHVVEEPRTMSLDFARLFGHGETPLSNDELLDLLYGETNPSEWTLRTLRMVVADDTMVVGSDFGTAFSIRYMVDTCKERGGEHK